MRARLNNSNRQGAIYLIVLMTALIVSVIALTSLGITRTVRQSLQQTDDLTDARMYAQAAIEMGLLEIKNNTAWRTTNPNGVWQANRPIGKGTYSLEGRDPIDGNLANSDAEPVVLVGIGIKGDARHKLEVTVAAVEAPLQALKMALHSKRDITVASGKTLAVDGAPLSANSDVINDGTIRDPDLTDPARVECKRLLGSGTVQGTVITNADPKPFPDRDVFAMYRAIATQLPYSPTIERQVIAPGLNTLGGGTNADGVYYIDAGAGDITIRGSRINGTLIIRCRRLIVTDEALIHSFRPDYPTLMVEGELQLATSSGQNAFLSELAWTTNFNPPGAPYNGSSDVDVLDLTYPNRVDGLVHVRGAITLSQTALVRGVVLAESNVQATDNNRVTHNASIYRSLPIGYTTRTMKVVPGSTRQVVD